MQDLPALGLLQVYRDAFLGAVGAHEIKALALVEMRRQRACRVALARLYLDDFSSQIGQLLGAIRSGEEHRQVDDPDSVQRGTRAAPTDFLMGASLGGTCHGYRPVKTGLRFSLKASTPSSRSCVGMVR